MKEAVLIITVILNIMCAYDKSKERNLAGVFFHISLLAIVLVCYYLKTRI